MSDDNCKRCPAMQGQRLYRQKTSQKEKDSEMKMSFEMALAYLKQGKRIRRAYWPEEVYLFKGRSEYNDESVIEAGITEHSTPWFWAGDLLEEDWEVME